MAGLLTGDVVLVLSTFEADALAAMVYEGIDATGREPGDLTERQANICARILHDMGYRKM